MNKLQIIDVTTGESVDFEPQGRRATRSKTDAQKQELINYFLYGRQISDSLPQNITMTDSKFMDVVLNFSFGTQKDIEFLAKTLVYTREFSYNGSLSVFGLYLFSCSKIPFAKTKFKEIFNDVIKDFDDLTLFLNFIVQKRMRGFGKMIQKTVNAWFEKRTTLDLVNYYSTTYRIRNGSQANRSIFTLADIVRYCHIKSKDPNRIAIYKFLITRDDKIQGLPSVFPAIKEFLRLSAAPTISSRQLMAGIAQGSNIPLSLVARVNIDPLAVAATVLRSNLGEIIANFNQITIRGAWKNENAVAHAATLLNDPKIVKAAGYSAFSYVMCLDTNPDLPPLLVKSIRKAIYYLVESLPKTEKKICIFVDEASTYNKTSIPGNVVSDQSVVNTIAAFLYLTSKEATLLPFDKDVKLFAPMENLDLLSISERMGTLYRGAAADFRVPFNYLIETQNKYDYIIFLSGGTPWRQVMGMSEINSLYDSYVASINPETKFIFLNLAASDRNSAGWTRLNTMFINGFNVNSTRFILESLNDIIAKHKEYIEKSELE